jgi:DNA-binding transcriptional regulator YbjK
MARNDQRRADLADAGLHVLADQGARGLTHRAVDRRARVPLGTTSNYFRSRADLVAALVDRISERLTPDPDVHAERARRPANRALFAAYIRDIVQRLTQNRNVTLALFELRLEAARHPELAPILTDWLRTGFRADGAFTQEANLPADAQQVALFHYAIDGLLLDRLTLSIDPCTSTDDVVAALVEGLLPGASGP